MRRRDFLLSAAGAPTLLRAAVREPLRRADSFFGLHFDLHPNQNDLQLGRDLTDAMADRLLDAVKPDYVQYDCKGHVGYMGYPSKVSTPAGGFAKDSLAIWRAATERHGAALYIHFSGVWDSLAVEQHPEWARVDGEGKRDARQTSVFGPYVDERMIPQLKEAAGLYRLNGAWVDGECWATGPDYSDAAKRAWGDGPMAKSARDPGWLEFLEFQREQFRKYIKHYIDAVHSSYPKFQIASNWLYTTYVPERPTLPVDFISGDYLGTSPLPTARIEARYLSQVDKPWDLMAWGFSQSRDRESHLHKPAVQLKQEASVVLAQGGGFQIYYQPTRTGYLDDSLVRIMADVAQFCRSRQAVSHKSVTVPQVGLLFSKNSLYNTSGKLFGGWPGKSLDPVRGMLAMLLENHFSVDVIPEWRFNEVARSYGLIVVPGWADIGVAMRDALLAYAKAGGHVLIEGVENAKLFEPALQVRIGASAVRHAFLRGRDQYGDARGQWLDVDPRGAEVVAERLGELNATGTGLPAATQAGGIVCIYGNLGEIYSQDHTTAVREFLGSLVRRVFQPRFQLQAPPTVEAVLRTKGGATHLHLINSTSMQVAPDYGTIDYIPAVGPIGIEIQLPAEPRKASLRGSWSNGKWQGTLERLEIHSVISFS